MFEGGEEKGSWVGAGYIRCQMFFYYHRACCVQCIRMLYIHGTVVSFLLLRLTSPKRTPQGRYRGRRQSASAVLSADARPLRTQISTLPMHFYARYCFRKKKSRRRGPFVILRTLRRHWTEI